MNLGTKKDWELKQKCACDRCPYCKAPTKHTGPPPPPPPPKPEPKPKKKPNRPEWLKNATQGLEGGYLYDCLFEGKSWALIREPGRKYWSGIGNQAYGRTSFQVWKKEEPYWGSGRFLDASNDVVNKRPLYSLKGYDERPITRFECHKGRMNKALLETLIEEVLMLDERRP